MRSLPPVVSRFVLVAALIPALGLAGCSAPTSLDIPETTPSATDAATATSEPTPTEPPAPTNPVVAPSADAPGTIDCEEALSPSTIDDQLGFPDDYVKLTTGSGNGTCVYTIGSGNAAITATWAWTTISPGDLELGWPADAESVAFGDAAAIQVPDASSGQPTNFQALAGNVQLTLSAFVGSQADLESFARALYAGLGITVG